MSNGRRRSHPECIEAREVNLDLLFPGQFLFFLLQHLVVQIQRFRRAALVLAFPLLFLATPDTCASSAWWMNRIWVARPRSGRLSRETDPTSRIRPTPTRRAAMSLSNIAAGLES